MFRRFSVNFALLSMVTDAVVIASALLLAAELRPLLNTLPFTRILQPPLQIPLPIFPIFAITWVMIFLLFGVYDGRKNLYIIDELTSITLGSILACVALAGMLYLSFRDVSRVFFLIFVLIAFSGTILWRLGARAVFRLRKGNVQLRRVLIIGAGPVGRNLETQIRKLPYLGLDLVGFLDDNPAKRISQADVLGTLEDVRNVINTNQVDDVVFALPRRAHEKVNHLVAELHKLPVKVWIVPDYFHLALHKATIEEFAGIPMLDLRAPALTDFQRMAKRTSDLILSLLALPFTVMMMIAIAIAIRLEGPGPIFFKQERVGENGRIFGMYKFRTMVPNAEELRYLVERYDENGNLIHKIEDDPRVTRVGKILRRLSLDELPQFFNILKGDMSLVGPRPEIPYLVSRYEPWQHKRFVVPQGLTGWWQVNGRSDKPMHLHTEDDIYYVQNYSLLLDLQILIKTVLAILRRKGAY